MGIKLAIEVKGGVPVAEAEHRVIFIGVHMGRDGSVSGRIKSYRDSATANAEGEDLGDVVVIDIPFKGMSAKMKAAVKTLLGGVEETAIAEAEVVEVVAEPEVVFKPEVEANEAEGIEAEPEVKAKAEIEGVAHRPAGKLFGGTIA